jgi:pimeloyl-ACP methyl ester carboxylesterase
MPTLSRDALEFYYETAGDPAAPPLLIISGLTDNGDKCRWQTADWRDDFFTITFDNRGSGRSTTPPPGYTTADMADDAAAVLDALDVAAAHVFGFSLGGMVALQLALRQPERLRRLVLGCTSAGGTATIWPESRVTAALLDPSRSGDRRRDFLDGLWISLGPRTASERPDLVAELGDLAVANTQTPEGYAGQVAAALTHDVTGRLSEITAPTLVLHGEQDLLIPPENGRYLAAHIPGARLILYPDAGHLFFIERAAEVNRDVRHFLQDEQTRHGR